MAERCLAGARNIAARTNNARAKRIVSEVLEGYVLAAPCSAENGDGPDFVRTACVDVRDRTTTPSPTHRFIPLLPEDADVSPQWAKIVNGGGSGLVLLEHNAISVKFSDAMSPMLCGSLYLHEGSHIADLREAPRDLSDPNVFLGDEVRTHMFQYELHSKLGGEPYRNQLEILIHNYELKRCLSPDGSFTFPPCPPAICELDQAFGKAESDYEYKLRTSMLRMHACMEYLARKTRPDMRPKILKSFIACNYQDFLRQNTPSLT